MLKAIPKILAKAPDAQIVILGTGAKFSASASVSPRCTVHILE